ncbi:MAG: hypothetical protein ABL886_09440 [Rhodoglobus sp.]
MIRRIATTTLVAVICWATEAVADEPTAPPPPAPQPDPPPEDDAAITKLLEERLAAERDDFAMKILAVDGDIQCRGFSLLTPLFGVSGRRPSAIDPNKRNRLRVTGPVESGVGGGYYRAFSTETCSKRDKWIAHWEVFAFSEGLNPATTFHVGLGGGVGITAVGRFQFGLALGYDLIRRETINEGGVSRTYSNGLLIWNDVTGCGSSRGGDGAAACAMRNFTWLLTFGLSTSSAGNDEEDK